MPRLANGAVSLGLFCAVMIAGAIGTAPLYLPRLSAPSADHPQTEAGRLETVIARLNRMAEQIERLQNAQQYQDQTIAALKAQQERASDRIATATRQMLDLAEYATRKGPITRQEFDELKQAMSLSQQQLEALRAASPGALRRTAQRH